MILNISRKKSIEKTVKAGIAVCLCVLAALVVFHALGGKAVVGKASARSIFVAGHLAGGGGGGNTSWSNWDETTETGWGDSTNNFIVIGDAAAAADNEVGHGGGLAGPNLVFTQNGSPVANGTYRTMDGGDDYFTWTVAGVGTFIGSRSVYTVIWKFADYADITDTFISIIANGTHYLYLFANASDQLALYFKDGGLTTTATTVNVISPTSGTIYFAIWSDGTDIKAGFCETKPTALTDFAANSVATINHTSAIATASVSTSHGVGYSSSFMTAKWYYFVASKLCLIDNSS